MNDTDDLVVDMSWSALNAVTKVSKYNRGSVLYIFLVLDIHRFLSNKRSSQFFSPTKSELRVFNTWEGQSMIGTKMLVGKLVKRTIWVWLFVPKRHYTKKQTNK